MKRHFIYGCKVDFYTVLCTEITTAIFLPLRYPWERFPVSETSTIIKLSDGYEIQGNLDAKLLIMTEHGIKEAELPFKQKGNRFYCDLRELLNDLKIPYEECSGKACDDSYWQQRDYTSEVLYCKDGLMEHMVSPYWGEQYELYFVNRKYQPRADGHEIKILRWNHCDARTWTTLEPWFRYLIRTRRKVDSGNFTWMLRDLDKRDMRLYMRQNGKGYDWVDYKDWFYMR